jgi:hypothetical protein
MSATGDRDLLAASRTALLDALQALRAHRDAVIVVGAQAIYLHTGRATVALAEFTRDSDLALDARRLGPDPRLEDAMAEAGFTRPLVPHPGRWLTTTGVEIDIMVPESMVGPEGRRGARIPPHATHAARKTAGLEAAVVDHVRMDIPPLAAHDDRILAANVASPAALLIAKLHKLGERRAIPGRLVDKDAHDVYRLLATCSTAELTDAIRRLQGDAIAAAATSRALVFLRELFADGPEAIGSRMAGRAEEGVGDPAMVSASVAVLAGDLLANLGAQSTRAVASDSEPRT